MPQNAEQDAVPPSAEHTSPSAAALRMRWHRARRREKLRCVIIELREREVDTLIRQGRLSADDRANVAALRKALYGFLDAHLR
jgi:hypothetical protein